MNGMRTIIETFIHFPITTGIVILLLSLIGCGAVGPPIPPEEVGIEAKVRKQQQDQARKEGLTEEEQLTTPVEEAVELPALYPIGTR
jgi:predicted small lipoprotein YifL